MSRATPLHLVPTLLLGLAGLAAPPASAQSPGPPGNLGLVVRDGTLGSAPAGVVAPGLDDLGQADYLIRADLGEQRDRNLFHSFERFSIGSGERATFTDDGAPDPGAIENVISRVTGDERSDIHGVLHSTIPGADLWLLNPSGVVFGAGAQLDVPGSFHASTGDYVGFGADGLERFYSDLSRESVLSTATPLAFGFLGESGAALLAVERSALEVPDGETLELAGGDVSLTLWAEVAAPGGEVWLEAQGEVRISQSLVDVNRTRETPGTISIRGGQIVVEKSSLVRAENQSGVPPPAAEAGLPGPGSISIEASESVLVDASLLSVSTHGAGNAGTIDIESPEVTLRQGLGLDHPDRPQLPHRIHAGASAETTGSGAAGLIEIESTPLNASDVTTVTVANGAGLSAQTVGVDASAPASGAGGTVRIVGADEVRVADRGFVTVESWGSNGDAGSIEILDVGALEVDGDWLTTLTADSLASVSRFSLLDASREQTPARAGAIRIDANSVDLLRGGAIESRCLDCVGGGGEIHITAQDLTADGRGGVVPNRDTNARVHWGVGSHIDATTFGGEGDAGRIAIRLTGDLKLTGGAQVTAMSFDGATGNAGDISIEAGEVRIEREPDEVFRPSGIFAESAGWLGSPSQGDAGHIHIEADSLVLKSEESLGPWNSTITAHALLGSAGTIELEVRSLEIDNGQINATNRNDVGVQLPIDGSHIGSTSRLPHGGTVAVNAGSVTIKSGGDIVAGTEGTRPGGTITIDADSVVVDSGFIDARTSGAGKGGTITLGSDLRPIESLLVDSGGSIDAGTTGAGNAEFTDTIKIDARSLTLRGGGQIAARGGTGNGGSVVIDADTVQIGPGRETGKQGPGVFVTSFGTGNPGSAKITARDWIRLDDAGGDRFDLGSLLAGQGLFLTGIASGGGGAGGPITLNAPEITVSRGAFVTSSSFRGLGGGGIKLIGKNIRIEEGGFVTGTSLLTPFTAGDVILEASESIEVVGRHPDFAYGSQVSSSTLNQGPAGAVKLKAPRIVVDGGAVATTAVPLKVGETGGAGGGIELDARFDGGQVIVRDGGRVDASTVGSGAAGRIDVWAGESIRVEGASSGIATRTGADGHGGTVELHAPRIEVTSGGEVSARSAPYSGDFAELGPIIGSIRDLLAEPPATAMGPAGVVRLLDAEKIHLIGGRIATSAGEINNGGNIELRATKLVHLDAGEISASVNGGAGGNIAIDPEVVILENGSRIVATAAGGSGGNIQITADNYFAFPGTLVDASSDLGLDGIVEVHTPDVDLAGNLTALPTSYLDASSLMRERCAARRSGERSGSFAVRGNGGIPPEPDGWLRASVIPDAEATAAADPPPPILVASLPGPFLAQGTCE